MTDDIAELKALLAKRDAQIVYLRAQLRLDVNGVPAESHLPSLQCRISDSGEIICSAIVSSGPVDAWDK